MSLDSIKNKLRDGVLLVKERLLHPERFIRGSSEKAMRWTPEWDRGKPLSPKERIAARLQLVVWLKELEHELIRETLADGEGLLAAKVAKAEVANEENSK